MMHCAMYIYIYTRDYINTVIVQMVCMWLVKIPFKL